MNKKQKTCLLVSMATMVVMGLFPPWVIESREANRLSNTRFEYRYTTEPGPYSWIGDPPQARKANPYSKEPAQGYARFIDLYRLGIQYFIVAVVTAGLIIIFRDEKATKQ